MLQYIVQAAQTRWDKGFWSRLSKFLGACRRCEVLCNSPWNVDLWLLLLESWNNLYSITLLYL